MRDGQAVRVRAILSAAEAKIRSWVLLYTPPSKTISMSPVAMWRVVVDITRGQGAVKRVGWGGGGVVR